MQPSGSAQAKYDQLSQAITYFNQELDEHPATSTSDVQKMHKIFINYRESLEQLKQEIANELDQELEGPKQNQNKIQGLMDLQGDLDRTEKLFGQIINKIDGYAKKFFPASQSSSQTGMKSNPKEEFFKQIEEFSKWIELFTATFLEQSVRQEGVIANSEKKKYRRMIAQSSEEIAKFTRVINTIKQSEEVVEIEQAMLQRAHESLETIKMSLEEDDVGSSSGMRESEGRSVKRVKETERGAAITNGYVDPSKKDQPLLSLPWVYNVRGASKNDQQKNKNYAHYACLKYEIANSEQFYQMTKEVWNALGDGCCGYYAFATLLVRSAILSPEFKTRIDRRIEALSNQWPPKPEEILFNDNGRVRVVNKKQLVKDVRRFFASLGPATNLNQILTKETGQMLNLFFRTAVREGMQTGVFDEQLVEAFDVPYDNDHTLHEDLTIQYEDIQAPVITALNQLLGTDIGIIYFDRSSLQLPERPARDGYVLQVPGHYVVAFPRT